MLAGATDFRDTLERLAEVAVPALADLCVIDILTDTGPVRMVGRHADPALRGVMEEVVRDYSPTPGGRLAGRPRALGGERRLVSRRSTRDWLRPGRATPATSSWCTGWASRGSSPCR